jgi:4-amino-4-deoxy-L-arabinose transferase-like glycosyltransferase
MMVPDLGISVRPFQLDGMSTRLAIRRQKTFLLLISAAVALLSHVVFLLALPSSSQRNQSTDYEKYYDPVAENLASGRGLSLTSRPALLYPCGLPIMYAATFRIADALNLSRHTGLRIVEALFLTLSSVLVTLTALLILSWRVALVASAMWSTYPFHLWLTKQPDGTSAFTLLLLIALFLFIRWSAEGCRSVQYGSLAGLSLGLAALIKPFAIGLPVIFAAVACICVVRCRPKKRAVFSSCVILAYILAISPWELWARKVSGSWIPLGTNGPNVLIDGLTLGTVRGVKPVWLPQNVQVLTRDAVEHRHELKTTGSIVRFFLAKAREEPAVIAEFFLIKAARSWYGNETHTAEKWVFVIQLLYFPFVILGARELWRGDRQQKNLLLMVTAIGVYFWAMTTFTALPLLRYLVPAMSLVMIVAAVACDGLAVRWFHRIFLQMRVAPDAEPCAKKEEWG